MFLQSCEKRVVFEFFVGFTFFVPIHEFLVQDSHKKTVEIRWGTAPGFVIVIVHETGDRIAFHDIGEEFKSVGVTDPGANS